MSKRMFSGAQLRRLIAPLVVEQLPDSEFDFVDKSVDKLLFCDFES